MRVDLTEAQVRQAVELAHLRNDPKVLHRNKWRDQMDAKGRPTAFQNHVTGALGEIAVASRIVGGQVDTNSYGHRGDGDVGDILVPGAGQVQVKTRTRAGWDFALGSQHYAELKADFCVLCWPGSRLSEQMMSSRQAEEDLLEFPFSVFIVGLATRQRFWRWARKVDYGYGPRLMLLPVAFSRLPAVVTPKYLRQEKERDAWK